MIVALGVIIPFVGTSLGALLVFFIRGKMNEKIEKILLILNLSDFQTHTKKMI